MKLMRRRWKGAVLLGDEVGLVRETRCALRVARRAVKLCLEWPYGILFIAHLEAFLSYDMGL